jgi:excisionase family DNA binding protein
MIMASQEYEHWSIKMNTQTISISEWAKAVGIGKNRAYDLAREGRLKTFKIGEKRYVPRSEISDFLEREVEAIK